MNDANNVDNKVRAYWDSRAQLGELAGTRDVIAKQLEIETIAKYIRDGLRILEVGCGNGLTAIELARRYDIDIVGIDFAEQMITAARDLAKGHKLRGRVKFEIGDVQNMPQFDQMFDLIYTERVLINLPNWSAQRQALRAIANKLVKGGRYLMCENSRDGLEMINALRERLGLASIKPPWHNRYFRDEEINQCNFSDIQLEKIDFYSSTYYLLSRIVNAAIAAQENKEPEYDSSINQLALKLPSIGELGQGRIWVWRKLANNV